MKLGEPHNPIGGEMLGLNQREEGVWRAFWAFVTNDKPLKLRGGGGGSAKTNKQTKI